MDILGGGIHVGQKPVAQNVSLDAESELQLSVLLEVHQLSFGLLLGSRGSLEHVRVVTLGSRLSSRLFGFDRKLEDVHSPLECLDRLDQITLAKLRRRRDLAFVERATEAEDAAVLVNLQIVSNVQFLELSIVTDVDVEIGVVDIKPVGRLFEVLNKVSECSFNGRGILIHTTWAMPFAPT